MKIEFFKPEDFKADKRLEFGAEMKLMMPDSLPKKIINTADVISLEQAAEQANAKLERENLCFHLNLKKTYKTGFKLLICIDCREVLEISEAVK